MGLMDIVRPALWGKQREDPVDAGIELADVIDRYDMVEITDSGTVIVVDPARGQQLTSVNQQATAPQFGEIGRAGNTYWGSLVTEEYNSTLRGKSGLLKYVEMKKSDAQVRGSLRLIKTPILSARWYVEPASDDPEDVEIAEFVEWNLFHGMTASWPHTLQEVMYMLDYGHYVFEKVFDIVEWRGNRRVIWQKLAPRHPIDIEEWVYDEQGGPEGIRFLAEGAVVFIPINKLLVFTYDKEGGNMEGISVLRSAYKHWYFKENLYKIDAIQKERHGIGIPIIKLPPNFSDSDLLLANELGENLRTNEKSHVVLPPMWEIEFAKLEGQQVDALRSAEHHGEMIYANILAQFTGATTQRFGSDRAADQRLEMFSRSIAYIADSARDVLNKWAVPELVNFNWPEKDRYPELRVHRIGETRDWRTLSFAIRNFIGAGVIQPDERLEEWIRDEMDLPKRDPDTRREVVTPQLPGAAGPPRQSQAGNQRIEPESGRGGQDQRGD